jgi:hypothetical protein
MASEIHRECDSEVGEAWASKPKPDSTWPSKATSTPELGEHRANVNNWTRGGPLIEPKNDDVGLGTAIYGLFPDEESDAVEEVREVRRDL